MTEAAGDVGDLLRLVAPFAAKLQKAKVEIGSRDIHWYPYDTLSNIQHLDRLLTGSNRRLLELIGNKPLLDLGCGDGDLSFFFAELGCRVSSFDYRATNHNGMRGIRALNTKLAAPVEIGELDFDSQFSLAGFDCGLALLLGVIYHLKNPLYFLETLSRHAKFCVMSTKVANVLPDQRTSIAEWPVAYLVGEDELNQDNSNFWIFSETGFKRLLSRTNWKILDYWVTGDLDRRVFCLAQSSYGLAEVKLLEGWYEPEKSGWRWTMQAFSIAAPGLRSRTLRMETYVPEECLRGGNLTLTGRSESGHLFTAIFDHPGLNSIVHWLDRGDMKIEFDLSDALAPDERDSRQRGIIVSRLNLE